MAMTDADKSNSMALPLQGKHVLLGVGGGISAYKAPILVRAFTAAGAEVRVVLTKSAPSFVAPLALQAVSGNRVGLDLFEPGFEHEIGHIELARWADVVVVAPATANLLARMRAGMADDLLTTLLLATNAPVVAVPAMNTQMWQHAAVQENVRTLRDRGVEVVTPDAGELACREVGAGRQPDPPVIVAHAARACGSWSLEGRKVVVTAGPTREFFDPVRFLSNPSSGRMGVAVAEAAFAAGAEVTLIAGPLSVPVPAMVRVVSVVSAEQMRAAVVAECDADVLIMSAAVADWRPASRAAQKRKKSDTAWQPAFERTVDIIAEAAGAERRPRVLIGFAAETENVVQNAREKCVRKGLDGVVANQVGAGVGFGADTNTVTLVSPGEDDITVGPTSKRVVGGCIVEWAARKLEVSHG